MELKKLFGQQWKFEDFVPGELRDPLMGFAVKKKIFSGHSKYQFAEVFDTIGFGRMLFLDGFVQLSMKHEAVYHEMLTHPAFFYCKNPEKVLIIGGGDGGVLRQVVKYRSVKEIFLVDIDKMVTDVSKKYLPALSSGAFDDKRVTILHEDALNFVKQRKNYFDIIIDDLTDPGGPSLALWSEAFYQDIKKALKKDGIAIFQTGCTEENFEGATAPRLRKVFPFFKVHKAFVPCFPFGEHTFSVGSKNVNFDSFNLKGMKDKFTKLNLKTQYYSPEIHFASTVFPPSA